MCNPEMLVKEQSLYDRVELANPSIELEYSDVHKVLFILNLPGLDAYDRKKNKKPSEV